MFTHKIHRQSRATWKTTMADISQNVNSRPTVTWNISIFSHNPPKHNQNIKNCCSNQFRFGMLNLTKTWPTDCECKYHCKHLKKLTNLKSIKSVAWNEESYPSSKRKLYIILMTIAIRDIPIELARKWGRNAYAWSSECRKGIFETIKKTTV